MVEEQWWGSSGGEAVMEEQWWESSDGVVWEQCGGTAVGEPWWGSSGGGAVLEEQLAGEEAPPVRYGISNSHIIQGPHLGAPVGYGISKFHILQGGTTGARRQTHAHRDK